MKTSDLGLETEEILSDGNTIYVRMHPVETVNKKVVTKFGSAVYLKMEQFFIKFMENKHTHIYFAFLAVLVIIASVLMIKSGTSTRETKKDISSSFVSISSAESIMTENSIKHSTDTRHVFSVPRGNDMMQGNNSSNVFFTAWTLADFESWIANYKKMSYSDKAQSTSTFGTSYTFENLKINDNQNDASLTFDTFVQEHWFYFDTVSDFIEKNDKNADPNIIQ